MDSEYILCEKQDRVAVITINRPEKVNALHPDLLVQLKQTMLTLEEEGEVRAVVLRGAGDRAFSAGFDVTQFAKIFPKGNLVAIRSQVEHHPVSAAIDTVAQFPYPVIAMINGYAFGAGLELAMACDIRIIADTAKIGMPPAKISIVYRSQGLRYFIDAVGIANTKEIFLLGRTFDAQRAQKIGLVHHMIPKEQLEEFTMEMAQEISENAPLSLRNMKTTFSMFSKGFQLSPEDEAWVKDRVAEAYNSDDMQEGLLARKEKRKPDFKES